MGKSLLARKIRSPSLMTRDGFRKTKLNGWFQKLKNTRPRTMPTETASRPRTVLRTIATLSRGPSVVTKLHRKWTRRIRPPWKARSKKLSAGSTVIPPQRRRSSKRSRRNLKASLCLFFKRWEVRPVPEACRVCLTWEQQQVVPLLPPIRQEDLPSKKSIKRFLLHSRQTPDIDRLFKDDYF